MMSILPMRPAIAAIRARISTVPASAPLASVRIASRTTLASPFSTTSTRSTNQQTSDHFRACLSTNSKWASELSSADPDFFPTSAKGQAPAILWIGCSDSRVPETTVLGLKPGDVFTHRNIANIINPTDLSLLSVVQFSVFHLKVKHIVVCGHTSCGGVAATLANGKLDILDVWLQPMRAVREKHAAELDKLEQPAKGNRMSELNVQAGVEVIKRIPVVIDAMRERGVTVHGVVYDLASGKLNEVECSEDEPTSELRSTTFQRS